MRIRCDRTSELISISVLFCSDKTPAVNEEEYNVLNKRHLSPEGKNYHVQSSNKEESRYQGVQSYLSHCNKKILI